MSIREKWDQVDIPAFVAAWLSERRNGGNGSNDSLSMKVTLMSFSASPEVQWTFIKEAIEQSSSDDELGEIAAGPFETLFGKHGTDYIDRLEEQSQLEPKFGRMTTGAWQHTMTDDIWTRVQAIQKKATPLDG